MTQSTDASGKRNLVDGGEVEVDVGVAAGFGIGAGTFDHGWRHIDADGAARRSNLLRCEKYVEAAAGAEIDNNFSGPEMRGSRGIAAGESHVGFRGNRCEFFGRVAEGFGHGFNAGVVAGKGTLGYSRVL